MRASIRPLAYLVCTIALVLAAIPVLRLSAQVASPAASEAFAVTELVPGVTAEVYSGVPSGRAPGQTLYTARFDFQPGAEIFPHSHPGTTSLTVVSGTFG
jgi:quercetin dioxygenase-like cupin family protein